MKKGRKTPSKIMRKRNKRRMSKGMKWSLVGAIVLVALTVYVLMCCFSSQRQMRNSVVVVQSNVWYSVGTGANKVVYFAQSLHDSTFLAPCTTPKALIETPHFTSGFWANKLALLPTSSGRVVTAKTHYPAMPSP